ncbi:YeeE/YedE thiosulfate transporter family protein [Verrucomicrobiales bacterium BCK34]|nr:YeeE/YedE thiosulfate transporter family protein [Verrucomicrobiales bacterium BCK34]
MSSTDITDSPAGASLSLRRKSWNPYTVGAGIGILSWLVFLIVNKPLGMSTEISKFSGWFVGLFTGQDAVLQNPYWASKTPAFGYSTVFLIFTAVGAFISAKMAGDLSTEKVPPLWAKYQGSSVAKRMVAAFAGGVLLLFGARMAGGCTSGHGISGTLQLGLSSWLFFPVMLISGIITAKVIFRKQAG